MFFGSESRYQSHPEREIRFPNRVFKGLHTGGHRAGRYEKGAALIQADIYKPELLSPAGTVKAMRYAFAFGADAVYAGQPRYSLRVRENEFHQLDVMAEAIEEAHRQKKKFYIASNIAA